MNNGFCRAGGRIKIASYALHFGEEPGISGNRGSGTIFFSGCNMRCVFCQNYPISQLANGEYYTIDDLTAIMVELQNRGAHNINLVSPTPYIYHLVHALYQARSEGLVIPLVYNTSGYERPEIVKILAGLVDVYMPDFKYVESSLSLKYSGVSDYFENAFPSLQEMVEQTGGLINSKEGIIDMGTIIRHLILPGEVDNSIQVLKKIASSCLKKAHLSLMSQYFPAHEAASIPGKNRRLSAGEYRIVKKEAQALGLSRGWFQDLD